jgi:hypothetical protein
MQQILSLSNVHKEKAKKRSKFPSALHPNAI